MAKMDDLKSSLDFRRAALKSARAAYLALLDGQVKSYAIGSRNLTRLDLPQLKKEIDDLEREVDELESTLGGGGRRKAVGVVIRDW